MAALTKPPRQRRNRIGLPDPLIIHQRIAADAMGEEIPRSVSDYGIPAAWKVSRGKGIKVGVIDTGIDKSHRESGDLAGAIIESRDFTGSRNGPTDNHGHGTHVCGTIGAREGNGIGVAGVAPECEIYVAKALGDDGSGSDGWIALAIDWLVSVGCRVINLSLGSPANSQVISAAVLRAVKAKVVIVCAAGNDGGKINFPARMKETISVAAVDENRNLASFSCWGPEQDIGAPGTRILSCYVNGSYSVMSGTSMAAPWVTGIIALAMSANPLFDTSPDGVLAWLQEHAIDVGDPGKDYQYGYGLVDVAKAFQKPEPPMTPPVPPPVVVNPPATLPAPGIDWSRQLGPVIINSPAKQGDLISVGVDLSQ